MFQIYDARIRLLNCACIERYSATLIEFRKSEEKKLLNLIQKTMKMK